MPKYLANAEIRHAVRQLARCSTPRGILCNFLIGLRALKLANADEVGLAESVPEFIQALDEFTLWKPEMDGSPYFNPFGSQAGFKSPKFRSNGPANTIHGWAMKSNSPFEVLETPKYKSIRRRPVSANQLSTFLIGRQGQDANRPRLIDAAIWFYRGIDLEGPDGATPDRGQLETRFINDLGLKEEEVAALFRREEDDMDEDRPGPEEVDSSSIVDDAAVGPGTS